MFNPLFSNDNDQQKKDEQSYLLGKRHSGRIEPLHKDVRPEPAAPHHNHKPVVHPPAFAGLPEAARTAAAPQPAAPEIPQAPKHGHHIAAEGAHKPEQHASDNPAADLIRRKLDQLYAKEPAAKEEIKEVTPPPTHRSKHQQYMYDLSTSGKSLAEIQTAWHAYYVGLPDAEKHEVWQEFYAASARRPSPYAQFVGQHAKDEGEKAAANKQEQPPETHTTTTKNGVHVGTFESMPPVLPHREKRGARAIKRQILNRVSVEAQEKAKRHLKSLAFGLSSGLIVLVVFLFGFFNEVIIAPFIQPSTTAEATPIILSTDGVAPTDKNEVIIPKINLEIPLDYSVTTTDENAIENSLENGVVHYPTTALPGQKGNTAYFGHSSNNIFNPGKYKFAFVLLHTLVPGDLFYITYNGKVYSYRVYQKQVVEPSDVAVLNDVADKTATATLITCDPPGTSLHRLVVWGEQISPDPTGNTAATTASTAASQPAALPSNGPTLWSRFIKWLF